METHKSIVFWYFSKDYVLCDERVIEWIRYRDIEMEIIEDAFQQNKTEVFLDKYCIDLKKFMEFKRSDSTQQRPVTRDPNCRLQGNLREERFFSMLPLIPAPSYGLAQEWCPLLEAWLNSTAGKRAMIDYTSAINACADGILQEAIKNKSDSVTEAKWMAEKLLAYKTKSRYEITKVCIYVYTRESFLYHVLNTALRNNDRSKITTLGPFCFLLRGFSHTFPGFTGTVYRGMNLSQTEIKSYEQAIGSWHTWPSFISTSKNRKAAEMRGNTLFIIKINCWVRGVEIAEFSQFPDEEEVLLPAGSTFQIVSVVKDPLQKPIIEIKI